MNGFQMQTNQKIKENLEDAFHYMREAQKHSNSLVVTKLYRKANEHFREAKRLTDLWHAQGKPK